MSKAIIIDLHGERFERYLVIGGPVFYKGKRAWICQCDCGKIQTVQQTLLRNGKRTGCACILKKRMTTHGMAGTPTHTSWGAMIGRCRQKNHSIYARYGGVGIKVCEKWLKFENFFADMGERPAGTTLDRFPNKSGNYEPGNCRWATMDQQVNNRSTNVVMSYNGKTMTAVEWAKHLGMKPSKIYQRLGRGWSVERTLTQPIRAASTILETHQHHRCL